LVSTHCSDLTGPDSGGGMQCPGCQQQNRPDAKFCDGCGIPLQRPAETTQSALSYSDLQHSLTEALARETATGEILRAIRSSPTDLQPVFDAIVQNASLLCGAANVSLYRAEGNLMRKV